MGALNRIILTGRLAADPEVRYTKDETPYSQFSVAVNRISKDKESTADFIRCVAWGNLAKVCGKFLKKGRLVALEGKLHVRKFESKGQKRSSAEVAIDNLHLVDNKFYQASQATEIQTAEAIN
jgi:single-strand DNA-binding protein